MRCLAKFTRKGLKNPFKKGKNVEPYDEYEDGLEDDYEDEGPQGYKTKSEEERIADQADRVYETQNHDDIGYSEFDEDYAEEGDLDLDDILDEFDDRTKNRVYANTKWYEKTLNVFIAAIMATVVLALVWNLGGGYLMDYLGVGQQFIEDQDITGRLTRYQTGVVEEVDRIINPEDVIVEEDRVEMKEETEVPVVIGEGRYLIGRDIPQGTYLVQKGSKIKKYVGEFEYVSDDPFNTNDTVNGQVFGANTLDTLTDGMYVTILEGYITLNEGRLVNEIKVNQTVVVQSGNHYVVGVDLPAGYYKVTPVQLQARNLAVTIGNPIEGQQEKVDVARQSYITLALGNTLQVGATALFTRVAMEFVY